jgi:predicted AlkP superfamily pyrophosphatase or phosphodiesterase
MTIRLLVLLAAGTAIGAQTPRKLVVLSVDGMDHRYLRDADRLGLRIPNLRKLIREGQWADGVEGVAPTVTWPSHITMMTGVRPALHGIRGNRRPKNEGGDYYWTSDLIRVPTLWGAAQKAGRTTAAITWPSTVGGPITWNLPEYFQRRRGGAMDLDSIAAKATPGLVERIREAHPSFAQQWVDDRTRALAALYLLKVHKPDLLTVHFVDLDAEAHETGPFSPASNAILEYTDELIGQILAALPAGTVVAVVSDHGFAKAGRQVNLEVLKKRDGAAGRIEFSAGAVCALDDPAALWLRKVWSDPAYGIGRSIPEAEWRKFFPEHPGCAAAFEPAEGTVFGQASDGEPYATPHEPGLHGLWPGKPEYRASFVLWGPGVRPERVPGFSMLEVAARLARVLDIPFPPDK